jgi:plastocyanin
MHKLFIFIVAMLLGSLAAGCQSRPQDLEEAIAGLEGPHTRVIVQNTDPGANQNLESEFNPPSLIIPPGTTVVWVNEDAGVHSVTEGTPETQDHLFDFEIPPGGYVMFTFSEPGLYTYYCRYHEHEAGDVLVMDETPEASAALNGGTAGR